MGNDEVFGHDRLDDLTFSDEEVNRVRGIDADKGDGFFSFFRSRGDGGSSRTRSICFVASLVVNLVLIAAVVILLLFHGDSTSSGNNGDAKDNKFLLPITSAVCVFTPLKASTASSFEGYVRFTPSEDKPNLINVYASIKKGCVPSALHGFHIHQYGNLLSSDGSTAGLHWNPLNATHGCPVTDHNYVPPSTNTPTPPPAGSDSGDDDGDSSSSGSVDDDDAPQRRDISDNGSGDQAPLIHAGDLGNLRCSKEGSGHANTTLLIPDDYPVRSYGNAKDYLRLILGRSVILHADPDDCTSQPSGNSGAKIAQCIIGVEAELI